MSSYSKDRNVKDNILFNYYSIQLIATKNIDKARKIQSEMLAVGYLSYIVPVSFDNKQIYRVRLGFYPSQKVAEDSANELKRRHRINKIVANSLVVKSRENLDPIILTYFDYTHLRMLISLGYYLSLNNKEYNLYRPYNSRYSIQITAIHNKEVAKSLILALRSFKYNSYVVKYKKQGRFLYRVRVGGSNDKEEILNIHRRLKKDFPKIDLINESIIIEGP